MTELEVYDRVRVTCRTSYVFDEVGTIVAFISNLYLVHFPRRSNLHDGGISMKQRYGDVYPDARSLYYMRSDEVERCG